jgi:hypothetical protein
MEQSPEARYPAAKPVKVNGTLRGSGGKSSLQPSFNHRAEKERSVASHTVQLGAYPRSRRAALMSK